MDNDWIQDEADRIKSEQIEAVNRLKKAGDVSDAMRSHWPALQDLLANDIHQLNNNSEIQRKIGGKIELSHDGSHYKIKKTVFPAVYLTVKWVNSQIEIEKTVVNVVNPRKFGQRGGETRSDHSTEKLEIVLNGRQLEFRNRDQSLIPFGGLSEYILKPMLIDHTVFPNFPFG